MVCTGNNLRDSNTPTLLQQKKTKKTLDPKLNLGYSKNIDGQPSNNLNPNPVNRVLPQVVWKARETSNAG